MGVHVESVNGNEIELEITPNRPDLFSLHSFAFALLDFLGKGKQRQVKLNKPKKNYEVIVDKSVLDVRPYTACAIIKNIKFDDEKIKEIIAIQEKLHSTLGRNRRKIAIGIYPLDMIKLPIKLQAKKPSEIKFIPLEFDKELNGLQILQQHPTGREYAHLLEGEEKFPIFSDVDGKILSMPPIINSNNTGKVTENTKDIFVECSGFDLESLKKTINILVVMFSHMGAEIYPIKVKHPKQSYITPDLTPQKTKLNLDYVNNILGLNLKEKQIEEYLKKMGHVYDKGFVLSSAWRADIMHEVDLIEDIAIAYGYNMFIPELPNIVSVGEENALETKKKKIANILCGLGLLEVSSYHLTTEEDQYKKMNRRINKEECILIDKSKTEYSILRENLIHFSLKILGQNIDSSYPQKIFELGRVFLKDKSRDTNVREEERLCITMADSTSNFTEIKKVLDYLMNMLGINYSLKQSNHWAFIGGRCGEIIVNNKLVGYIGEIHPSILSNLHVAMPVCALEISLEALFE
jgi:phenylalanyl-tRNA synthetase beta chain